MRACIVGVSIVNSGDARSDIERHIMGLGRFNIVGCFAAAALIVALSACGTSDARIRGHGSSHDVPNASIPSVEVSSASGTNPLAYRKLHCFGVSSSEISLPDEELYRSAQLENSSRLKALIENGINVAPSNNICRTFNGDLICRHPPLVLAVKRNDSRSVEVLLEAGADPNANALVARQRVRDGIDKWQCFDRIHDSTPLIEAIKAHDVRSIRLLLKYGADPTLTDMLGRSPMCHALLFLHLLPEKSVEIVEELRKSGAKLNFEGTQLSPPFQDELIRGNCVG